MEDLINLIIIYAAALVAAIYITNNKINKEYEDMENKDKLKVFIVQSQEGKTATEITEERKRAFTVIGFIAGDTKEVVDIADKEIDKTEDAMGVLYNLNKHLKLITQADVVYFIKGWSNEAENKAKYKYAKNNKIPIIEE